VLIERALRDEGTSVHYQPPGRWSRLDPWLRERLDGAFDGLPEPVVTGASWTTDAPYRETADQIAAARLDGAVCVEMEAAALYAYATALDRAVVRLAHVTNTMPRVHCRHREFRRCPWFIRSRDDDLVDKARHLGRPVRSAPAAPSVSTHAPTGGGKTHGRNRGKVRQAYPPSPRQIRSFHGKHDFTSRCCFVESGVGEVLERRPGVVHVANSSEKSSRRSGFRLVGGRVLVSVLLVAFVARRVGLGRGGVIEDGAPAPLAAGGPHRLTRPGGGGAAALGLTANATRGSPKATCRWT